MKSLTKTATRKSTVRTKDSKSLTQDTELSKERGTSSKTLKSKIPTRNKPLKKAASIKKIPASVVSKWQSAPQGLQDCIVSMLENSISSFPDSGNNETNHILGEIRVSVNQALKKVKVPKERWTDIRTLKLAREALVAEKLRLENLERGLKFTLEEELRHPEEHPQTEEAEFEEPAGSKKDQLHYILQRLQEST